MPLTPKSAFGNKKTDVNTVDVESLINKGLSSSAENDKPAESVLAMVLRLPGEMAAQVDAALKSRRPRIPRHTWILEAVHEKLKREGKSDE